MNDFGRILRMSVFGESHGDSVGIIVDGVPHGISLKTEDFFADLSRRKTGKFGSSERIESDKPQILSGVFNDFTTGAPILISFKNENINSKVYNKNIPRPGHSDFTASVKYNGYNDFRGGGHFSGRITLGLVAAGVIAKKIIPNIRIEATIKNKTKLLEKIKTVKSSGDSVGGIVECRAKNLPVGLGEPFFDSMESVISHLAFSIPGVKGIEFGKGFKVVDMLGSETNDLIIDDTGKTLTNNAGGINGGISNGNELVFRIAIKPTSSISVPQKTFDFKEKKIKDLKIKGRHDICFALRAPVIVEGITAFALADFYLLKKSGDNLQ